MKDVIFRSLAITLVPVLLAGCLLLRYRGAENTSEFEMDFEGRTRQYYLYVPESLPPRPDVLFVLHGGGGKAIQIMGSTRGTFDKLAESNGFIVVYPQGIEKQWNDGRKDPKTTAHQENINDAGFLMAIRDRIKEKYGVSRTFFTGISNGGMMSLRMGCEFPDRVNGVAPVASSISVDIASSCAPAGVSLLILDGKEDPLVPYDGGSVKVLGSERGSVIGAPASVRLWLRANGCQAPGDFSGSVVQTIDNDPEDATKAVVMRFNCKVPVELVAFEGAGHTWPGSVELLPEWLVGKLSMEMDGMTKVADFFGLIKSH
ncbi:MAG: hypothetical protein KDK37_16780 [Leptospiraceae bacterium]|nr:hypothetical protein [Leptospiraceae bacterium]